MRLFYILIVLLFVNNAYGELPLVSRPSSNIPNKRIVDLMDSMEHGIENIGNPEPYKTTKIDGRPFPTLPAITQDFFYLWQSEEISILMYETRKQWIDLVVVLPDEVVAEDDSAGPNKKMMLDHLTRLNEMRKKHAIKYEGLIDKVCEIHKDKMTPKEIIHLKNRVKFWHDTQRLVDRK